MADIVARAKAALEGTIRADHESEEARGIIAELVDTCDGLAIEWTCADDRAKKWERAFRDSEVALNRAQTERDELRAEVERLRSDPTLALMGSQLERTAAERDQLKAALERVKRLANTNAIAERVQGRDGRAWLDLLAVIDMAETSAALRAALDGDDQSGDPS